MTIPDQIILNAPGTDGPPIPTYDLVQLTDIHTQKNLYQLYLSKARTVWIGNRSDAPILVQMLPVGGTQPIVVTIDPNKGVSYGSDSPIDSLYLSNLTDTPVPRFGIGLAGGTLVTTGAVQVVGFSTKVDFSIDIGEGTALGDASNPLTATINGNVPVVNPPGGIVSVGHDQTPLATGVIPANTTVTVTVNITTDMTCLLLHIDSEQNLSGFRAHGVQTGFYLWGQSNQVPGPAPKGPFSVIPINTAYDTQVTFDMTAVASIQCGYAIFARRDALLSAVTSMDQSHLTIVPAGNQMPIIPATLAATQIGVQTAVGNSNPVNVDGFNGALMVQLVLAGTSPTVTAKIQGSGDGGSHWWDVGHYRVDAVAGALTRAISESWSVAAGMVLQLLDYYPQYRVAVTAIGGTTPSLTSTIWGVPV